MARWKPTTFILDFDGTITRKDTIAALVQCAISRGGAALNIIFEEIISKYQEDSSTHLSNYRPEASDRIRLDQEVDYLQSLKDVEQNSFTRVSSSRIFRGISRDDWYHNGLKFVEDDAAKLTDGFASFVKQSTSKDTKVGVVSVNFSSDFIKGVLRGISATGEDPHIEVKSNWIDETGVIHGPEKADGQAMTTSDAKLRVTNALLTRWAVDDERVVYVGDSSTDLECLTRKSVLGIALTENGSSSLVDTLKRIGIEVFHIAEYAGNAKTGIYWAKDFHEIMTAMGMNE